MKSIRVKLIFWIGLLFLIIGTLIYLPLSYKKYIVQISQINYYIAVVILAGLGAGILVFLVIGFIFSQRIIKLKNFAAKLGQGDLEARIEINSQDEIAALASAFNEMALKMKEKIQEIKRLDKIEERNKIAFDLHDGCAQHAASIIKRIELCERLVKIDASKAVKELQDLKESTKDTLNWTRQIIFDLKSPQDTDFNLLIRLKDYLADTDKHSDIKVNMATSGSIDKLSADQARSIFYIVTEALANARKHSQAKNLELSIALDQNSQLSININDDGKGFDVGTERLSSAGQGKWGLITMQERTKALGGIFGIESGAQGGTKVSISIPLKQSS